jgi:hypothetical protein
MGRRRNKKCEHQDALNNGKQKHGPTFCKIIINTKYFNKSE